MTTLRLHDIQRRPLNTEWAARTAIAVAFVIGIGAFFAWFIATNLVR
jgi:hypothetical protein